MKKRGISGCARCSPPRLKQLLTEAATAAEHEVVEPLFEFRNYGLPLPQNWTTMTNGAQFGTDYYTRTAVAKSNILVNKPTEIRDGKRCEKAGELESAVAVGRAHHGNLYALIAQSRDTSGPFSFESPRREDWRHR